MRDLLAGFTLAAMNVPQALGYTRIAGTPVVTGLYTLLLPLVAFATLGSSRYLVVAADSATAAILAGGLSHLAPVASDRYVTDSRSASVRFFLPSIDTTLCNASADHKSGPTIHHRYRGGGNGASPVASD